MEERFLNSGRNCTALLCTAVFGALLLGTYKVSGQLFIACMDFFNVGRKEASLPFTLLHILLCMSGPLTGYLGQKYGALAVSEFGSLLCVVGVGGCFFAKSITTISILWGVVYGLGTGLGSLLIPHILRDFFEKNYDKAHGFYMAIAGIGGILLPLLSDILLNQYGLPGTFLILSALILNCIVASLILRSLKPGPHMYEKAQVVVIDFKNNEALQIVEEDKTSVPKATWLELNGIQSNGTVRGMCETIKMDQVPPSKPGIKTKTVLLDVTKLNTTQSEEFSAPDTKTKNNGSMREKLEGVNQDSTEPQAKKPSGNIFLDVLEIFIDPSFVIILITQGVFVLFSTTVYTAVIDIGRDVGVPPDLDVYTLVIIGISDMVGRLTFGFVTDGGCMSQLKCYALSLALLGIMSAMTVIKRALLYMIVLFVIGLIFGGFPIITVGLMYNYIEKDKMIIALPSRFFLYPFLGFAKPYLIEYFRECHGSYNGLMFVLAGMCFFSALLSLLLPAAKRFNEKRKEKLKTLSINQISTTPP